MICEKCGFSNEPNAEYCKKCAEKLPCASGGNGFADILSYNEQNERAGHFNSEKYITTEQMNCLKRKFFQRQMLSFGLTAIAAVLAVSGLFLPRMNTEQVSERVWSQLSDEVSSWIRSHDEEISATMSEVDEKMDAIDEEIEQIREMQVSSASSEEPVGQFAEDDDLNADSPIGSTNLDSVSVLDQETDKSVENQTEGVDDNPIEDQDRSELSSEIMTE